MKFLDRFRRSFYLTTLVATIAGAVVSYGVASWFVYSELDEELRESIPYVERHLRSLDTLPPRVELLSTLVDIGAASAKTSVPDAGLPRPRYADTLDRDPLDDYELEPYRKLTYTAQLPSGARRVTISLLKIGTDDLIEVVALGGLFVGLVLVVIIGYGTGRSSRRLWRPFERLLERLRTYRIGQDTAFAVAPDAPVEFAELAASLTAMASRLSTDYERIRAFAGNASHEMQTPVAIIAAQLERLYQLRGLPPEAIAALAAIAAAVERQKGLHAGLLTLARLAESEGTTPEPIALAPIVEDALARLSEAIATAGLTLDAEIGEAAAAVDADQFRILARNLLHNAIKYNKPRGYIRVELDHRGLRVINSGGEAGPDPERVFDRFYRGGKHGGQQPGAGLGLSIVKEICRQRGWRATFSGAEGAYSCEIDFRGSDAGASATALP